MITAIIINAATGRMGTELIKSVVSDADTVVAAALARESHPLIGTDIGYMIGANPQGKTLSCDYQDAFAAGDVLIDFSLPEHSMATLQKAVDADVPMVIGTTGFDESQLAEIEEAAKSIPIMLAANYSLGVNLLIQLAQQATKALSGKADIEIFEAHHKHKIDAPSGTALTIGEAIADAQDKNLNEIMSLDRSGKRNDGELGFSVMRAGEIVGTHEVTFALNGEVISLKHEAQNRQCFAQGAIEAAKWLKQQQENGKNGLFSISDMINSQN